MRIVTLTTDFGLKDAYVGAMKGAILSIAPNARIVDISHEVAPQDVAEGAFLLASAYAYFPVGSIHVAVVDPGVGTERRGMLIEAGRHVLVGPDNGVLSGVLTREPVIRAVALENLDLMLGHVSATFHGRDVFAPAAAHVARGAALSDFGPEAGDFAVLDVWRTEHRDGAVTGRILHVDRFGNCVTGIARADVDRHVGGSGLTVTAGDHRFDRIVRTYGEAGEGEALVYYGSLDTLEIAVTGGRGAEVLGLARGDRVQVAR